MTNWYDIMMVLRANADKKMTAKEIFEEVRKIKPSIQINVVRHLLKKMAEKGKITREIQITKKGRVYLYSVIDNNIN